MREKVIPQVTIPLKTYNDLIFKEKILDQRQDWFKLEDIGKGTLILRSKSSHPDLLVGTLNEDFLKISKGYYLALFKDDDNSDHT